MNDSHCPTGLFRLATESYSEQFAFHPPKNEVKTHITAAEAVMDNILFSDLGCKHVSFS